MNIQSRDEVIDELWKIKDQFATSSKGNVGELVKKVNEIAKQNGFQSNVSNRFNQDNNLTKKTS